MDAGKEGARKRRATLRSSAAEWQCGLTGMAAVQGAFHFLHGPADVLAASTACRRWRAMACADAVWRAKLEREGMEEKAGVFEVALPAAAAGEGEGEGGGGGGEYVVVVPLPPPHAVDAVQPCPLAPTQLITPVPVTPDSPVPRVARVANKLFV